MQGVHFLVLDQKGRPASHGVILQQITPERYLCHFARAPSSCRIHRLEVLENWHLFTTEQHMNDFIAAIVRQDTPPPPKKKRRKKAIKKKVTPNGKK